MRRALAWLLPGQGAKLSSYSSAAAPAWLFNAVETLSPVPGGISGARTCATSAGAERPSPVPDSHVAGDALSSYATASDAAAAESGPHDCLPADLCSPSAKLTTTTSDACGLPLSARAPGSPSSAASVLSSAIPIRAGDATVEPPLSSGTWLTSSSCPSLAFTQLQPGLEAYLSTAEAPLAQTMAPGPGPAAAAEPSSAAAASWSHPPALLLHSEVPPPLPLPIIHDGVVGIVACTAAEPSPLLALVQQVANSYELVHSASGLPWAASIPLTTLALRLALLPLSLRQARIIRSNFSLYREAVALTDQQERELEQERERHRQRAAAPTASSSADTDAGGGGGASDTLPSVLHARLQRSHAVLSNFDMLRRLVGAPHPAWLFVNPLVQIPVFVAVSSTLGIMCRLPWPGLSREGALWFQDLTLPAVVMDSGEMPMGPVGLALPLLVYGMTMTSLRLAFGASGVAGRQQHLQSAAGPKQTWGVPDTTLAAVLRSLAPLLYVLTTLNLYFKIQMAQGVLVHWTASAGFTLSLQLALRNPNLRALLNLNRPPSGTASASTAAPPTAPPPSSTSLPSPLLPSSAGGAADTTAAAGSSPSAAAHPPAALAGPQQPQHPTAQPCTHEGSGQAAPHHIDTQHTQRTACPQPELPPLLVSRVAETSDPNVLVIMGAQLSARHEYAGALHCLRRAVELAPGHVRAHYSQGQVHALTGCWTRAELSFRAAAELSPTGPEKGQAWYCVATALHSQGKLDEAAAAYADADAHWRDQTVISYGRANALAAAGRRREALAVLTEAEARDAATAGRPFRPALQRLRAALEGAGEGAGERSMEVETAGTSVGADAGGRRAP